MAKAKGATALAERPAKKQDVTKFPVEYGGLSVGDRSASLGITVDRAWLPLAMADEFFCGRRLTGVMIVGEHDPNQKTFAGMEGDFKVKGVFDVKRFGVSPGGYSFRASFNKADIDVETLSNFAKTKGRLFIEACDELAGDDPEDEEGDPEEADDDAADDSDDASDTQED